MSKVVLFSQSDLVKEVTFKYDPLGRRVEKSCEGKTTYFVWDGNTILHEWVDDASDLNVINTSTNIANHDPDGIPNSLVTWIFDPETFILSAKLTKQGKFSIITDHLGTPVEAYDSEGSRVWSGELDIYGRVKVIIGEKDFVPFRYQGQYEDIEIGLYYNNFRYYAPNEGIYTQQDPIGSMGDNPTLYSYVGDPNFWIDPFGLSAGRGKKQQRLKVLVNDPKQPRYVRGWMRQELNRLGKKRGNGKVIRNVRNPIGFELAHWYGYESDKGYDYMHSDLKVIQDHKNQHVLDDKGRKNKEGASKKAPCLLKKKK
ncbi:RHS repeat-associated core domain-containing protein [Lysinibacillus sp. NPDC093190]|uniref:RHS repeat-associated core domain-containing protein n=1 Tax=Lysinibacillus sp. NPDC093190 TaxID=3390575 RepID=UPI003D00DDF6